MVLKEIYTKVRAMVKESLVKLVSTTSYSDETTSVFLACDDSQYLIAASNPIAQYAYLSTALGITTNETVSVSGDEHVLVRSLDEWQRLHALTVDGQPIATYSYDADNRLSVISNASFVAEYPHTPDGYDAGHAITLTSGMVLDRIVEPDFWRRTLASQISNRVDGVPVSVHAYDYDKLSRITARNDDSFGYNARSEVTEASILSNAYSYAYDSIGNHTTSTVDAVQTTYTANSLNQYTSILRAPVPPCEPTYDLDGSAPSEARRFLRGASPRRARTSHPLVPSVGTMEEESNPNEVV